MNSAWDGSTVLKRAAGTGCAGMVMVRRLLEAGAAVDATADSADLAPLMFAAYMYHGHEAVVRVLLGAGASVCKATSEDIRDGARVLLSKGSTSLSIAEVRGHAALW